MDCERILECCVEEVDVGGLVVKALSIEAEVAVAAAHAVYKEHVVLLMDCLVAWSWMSKRAWNIAVEHGVEEALEALLEACSLVRRGLVEAPCRLKPHVLLKAYTHEILRDALFRSTLLNIPRYMARRDLGSRVSTRLTRRSY